MDLFVIHKMLDSIIGILWIILQRMERRQFQTEMEVTGRMSIADGEEWLNARLKVRKILFSTFLDEHTIIIEFIYTSVKKVHGSWNKWLAFNNIVSFSPSLVTTSSTNLTRSRAISVCFCFDDSFMFPFSIIFKSHFSRAKRGDGHARGPRVRCQCNCWGRVSNIWNVSGRILKKWQANSWRTGSSFFNATMWKSTEKKLVKLFTTTQTQRHLKKSIWKHLKHWRCSAAGRSVETRTRRRESSERFVNLPTIYNLSQW